MIIVFDIPDEKNWKKIKYIVVNVSKVINVYLTSVVSTENETHQVEKDVREGCHNTHDVVASNSDSFHYHQRKK